MDAMLVPLNAEAIGSFVRDESWRHQQILRGLEQANTGEFATEVEVQAVYNRER